MAQRPVGVTDVASGAGVVDYRTRERTVDAVTVVEQYVAVQRERITSFVGMASSFRTAGSPTHSLSLMNETGSGLMVAVLAFEAVRHSSSNSSGSFAVHRLAKISAASAGTVLTKVSVGSGYDTAETSSASVVVRSAASVDGTGTALTVTETGRLWHYGGGRLFSAAFEHSPVQQNVDPYPGPGAFNVDPAPITFLRPGEGIVGIVDTTSSVAQVMANILWEEYLLP